MVCADCIGMVSLDTARHIEDGWRAIASSWGEEEFLARVQFVLWLWCQLLRRGESFVFLRIWNDG